MMIILRPVEHEGGAFERHRVLRVFEIALAELVRDHARLHDRAVEEIAREVDEARFGLHRRVECLDDRTVFRELALVVLAEGLAVDRHRILVDEALGDQLGSHRRYAAGAMVFLGEVFACRLKVHQQRDLVADLVPVVVVELDAEVLGDRVEMDRCVGRPADRRVHTDRILEGLARHDLGRAKILPHHLNDAATGLVGALTALAIGGRDRGRAGQAHAQRFGEAVHGRGRAHRVAMAGRGGGRGYEINHLILRDLTAREHFARLPRDSAGTGALTPEPAVEHRPDVHRDRRHVDRRRRHQAGRGRLVTARGQHHAVERVAVEQLHQPEIGEVAVERRGRALAGFLNGMNREFHRDAAGLADALADALGEFKVMPVTRREIRTRLRDTDDRLAGLQLLARQAEIEVALEIEARHLRIIGIVEPVARTQASNLGFRRLLGQSGNLSFCWGRDGPGAGRTSSGWRVLRV